ncbi:MAG: exo-alpha-sialidase [Opitutaceae bacterium]|nr:exo-alpha-sialidase [Opitutaceae bacterium]
MKLLQPISLAITLAGTALGLTAAPALPLWNAATPVPKAAELTRLEGVRFHVIKRYEPAVDGYRFLHGVALAWHRDRLYASIGHNQGGENTETEEARFTVSRDGGKTWSAVATMDAGLEPGLGVSHGVFHAHGEKLWAFHGAYTGTMKQVHTRAYLLDDATGKWVPKGTVIEGGFWPLQEPVRMDDGNWIMAGARIGQGHPAAVAISRGGDFLKWDLVVIPTAPEVGKMWGESTVVVTGKRVINIARRDRTAPTALIAMSDDFGRTWTPSQPANLPMAASKPYAGRLSNGQSYLICSTTADGGNRRSPLTIAVSRPGESVFTKIFLIRPALFPEGPGESHEIAALAYPYAIEHAGYLYVGYSNSGGGVGRVGTGRELWNNNSAEMAVIPISSLQVR